MKRTPRRSRRTWRQNWPASAVVSGALTCTVREVVGSLGPTVGASTSEGQNLAQSTAHAASNPMALVQPVAPAAPTLAMRPNRGPFFPAQPERPSSALQSKRVNAETLAHPTKRRLTVVTYSLQ